MSNAVRTLVRVLGPGTLVGLLAACAPGGPSGAPPTAVPSPTTTATHGRWPADGQVEQPPPFELRHAGASLLLYPFTFCAESGCADGFDDAPPSIGDADELFVHVPVAGYTELVVGEVEADEVRPAEVEVVVERLDDAWWRLRLAGPPGDHLLSLYAGGDGSGDMIAEVIWTGGR
ncbi:hypothetical protein M1843_04970 [Isoptericola sp. 4D.3]|uniref:Lipoprotein n=1 Tax=Isoptericola peretonis TaxID=2918523 RepID=A0ABT0J0S9_9MICO|nr:hypothetical protein [Isoptericola sp. 4D.3]